MITKIITPWNTVFPGSQTQVGSRNSPPLQIQAFVVFALSRQIYPIPIPFSLVYTLELYSRMCRLFPSLLSLFNIPVIILPHFVLFEVRKHNVSLVVTVIEAEKSTDIQYLRKTDVKRPL